jgi:hypothetical protein
MLQLCTCMDYVHARLFVTKRLFWNKTKVPSLNTQQDICYCTLASQVLTHYLHHSMPAQYWTYSTYVHWQKTFLLHVYNLYMGVVWCIRTIIRTCIRTYICVISKFHCTNMSHVHHIIVKHIHTHIRTCTYYVVSVYLLCFRWNSKFKCSSSKFNATGSIPGIPLTLACTQAGCEAGIY